MKATCRLAAMGLVCVLAAVGTLQAAERTPLKEKFPEAGEAIGLIEEFPLLKTLLELNGPWQMDLLTLKDRISPMDPDLAHHRTPPKLRPMEVGIGTEEHPLLFIDRRRAYDWVTTRCTGRTRYTGGESR